MSTFLELVNSNSNPTPFGVHDKDSHFQADADSMVVFIKRRLGDDIMSVELTNRQIYSCFEEASLEHSTLINMHQAESHISNLLGTDIGTLLRYEKNEDGKYIGTYTDASTGITSSEGILTIQDPNHTDFLTGNKVIDKSDNTVEYTAIPIEAFKSGPNGKEQLFQNWSLETLSKRAEPYASEAGVGGAVDFMSGSIPLEQGRQDYSILNELEIVVSGSTDLYNLKEYDAATNTKSIFNPSISGSVPSNVAKKKIKINEVFHFSPQAAYRFFDTTSAVNYLNNQFAFESFTPETVFYVLPVFEDLLRAGQLDISNRIRRSNYSYKLQGNNIRIYPRPTQETPLRLFLNFSFPIDPYKSSLPYDESSITGISNISNLPYGNISYKSLNSIGRTWVKNYTLALCKEVLGLVRSKFSSVPIPGSDVQMNGSDLITQGRDEQANLKTQFKEVLDKLTYQKILESDATQAESMMTILKHIPIPNGKAIIIG